MTEEFPSLAANPAPASLPAAIVPQFLVRELHATLNWAVLIAILAIVIFVRSLFLLSQLVVDLTSVSGSVTPPLVGGLIAGVFLAVLISGWPTLCLLKYLAAIWRLREGSPMRDGEEALRRQHRLWIAMTAAAFCGAVGGAISMPSKITEVRAEAAEVKAAMDSVRIGREKEAEEAQQEMERKAHVKKLEEEYWQSKQEKPPD